MLKKITIGFVIQDFDDNGRCIHQEFIAGDEVNWETEDGEAIEIENQPDNDDWYHPFNMVQPVVLEPACDSEKWDNPDFDRTEAYSDFSIDKDKPK